MGVRGTQCIPDLQIQKGSTLRQATPSAVCAVSVPGSPSIRPGLGPRHPRLACVSCPDLSPRVSDRGCEEAFL